MIQNSKIKRQTCAGLHSCFCAMDFMTSFSSRTGCDGSLNPSGLLGAPIGENAVQTIPSAKNWRKSFNQLQRTRAD